MPMTDEGSVQSSCGSNSPSLVGDDVNTSSSPSRLQSRASGATTSDSQHTVSDATLSDEEDALMDATPYDPNPNPNPNPNLGDCSTHSTPCIAPTGSGPLRTMQSGDNDYDEELRTCDSNGANVNPTNTCTTRPPPPTRFLASPVPFVIDHPISTPITTQRSSTYPPDYIGRVIAERDTARAISEGLIPDDGAGIFPDGLTRLRLCKARLQRIADECTLIKSLETATKQQFEGDEHDTALPSTTRQPLPTQPSPGPLVFEHPISTPNAHTIRPTPKRAPPPAPMTGPKGFWRVGGYTAQRCEVLTYHSHTHTPITKPRTKRFEHGVRPFVENLSTKATAEIHRPDTKIYAHLDARATPQHCSSNRPKAHSQPPEPPTSTTPWNSFWKCTATPAAREDEADATLPSVREGMSGIKLSRHTQPPCPSHSPAVCSKVGVDANGDEVCVEAPRRAKLPIASHRLPLSPTPHADGQHLTADEDSLWPRITSVSRKAFARIYEFLTRSIPGQMTGLMTGLTQSPDSGHFSPPPPPGGGGCAGPPP